MRPDPADPRPEHGRLGMSVSLTRLCRSVLLLLLCPAAIQPRTLRHVSPAGLDRLGRDFWRIRTALRDVGTSVSD